MKILYLSFSYLPSRRANTVHVMRMCEAFAGLGHEVTLVGKRPLADASGQNDFEIYGMEGVFELRKLARPQTRGGELVYALAVIRLLVAGGRRADLVYSRYPAGAWAAARLGIPTVFEMHGFKRGWWARLMLRGILRGPGFRRLVLISAGLERDMRTAGLLPPKALYTVAHDGADTGPADAAVPPSLDGNRPQLGYVGGFYRGRGLALLAQLAGRMPELGFHLVGGDSDRLRQLLDVEPPANILCHGYVPHAEVARLCRQFDILLMPFEHRIEVAGGRIDTARWASPLKMFEYMAAGKPIVCSDLPVLREVLEHERNALLAPPDDIAAWEDAITRLLGDEALRRRLAGNARHDLESRYTWKARARHVLEGLDDADPSPGQTR